MTETSRLFNEKWGPEASRQMQQTSIEAYKAFTPRELGYRQKSVYHALLNNGPMSNKQLGRFLGWPINTITPRVKELRAIGCVFLSGFRYDSDTNRHEMVWEARE
jgi:DNA-binding MarR family transcriptional regulator